MNGRAAVVLACACCAACSLFLDTSEFSGVDGASVPVAGDSGAATSDGAAAPDGGGEDAAKDADAGPLPCPDGGFCDSFERTTLVGSWGGLTTNDTGCELAIDPTVGKDGASSLKSFLPQRGVDDCKAYLHREMIVPGTKQITLSFDVRIDSAVEREVQIAGFNVGSPDRGLFLSTLNGALQLAEQQYTPDGFYGAAAVSGLDPGTWHHVVLVHDVASKQTTVSFDGEMRISRPTTLSFDASSYELYVGNTYSRGGAPATFWFDDFRFVATP